MKNPAFLRRHQELYLEWADGKLSDKQYEATLQDLIDRKFGTYVVDLDTVPFIPEGWSIHAEDQLPGAVRGTIELSTTGVDLFLAKQQKRGAVKGHDLKLLLADQAVLSANLLDYYLVNPGLIPEGWKKKYVFFWGTVYRRRVGSPVVRFLYWDGGRCRWGNRWLGSGWRAANPAACAQASP